MQCYQILNQFRNSAVHTEVHCTKISPPLFQTLEGILSRGLGVTTSQNVNDLVHFINMKLLLIYQHWIITIGHFTHYCNTL